ncbi:MAG: 30S ribosomal protein S12 methylthiotransferase RimO [Acidobacteriota bacterium]
MVTPLKIGFVSLGCPKNTVDSEVMLGHLSRQGARFTLDMDEADVIVVNTCGFIAPAKEESIEAILEAVRRKRDGRCRRLVVSGCLVQRYRGELEQEVPEIDAFVDLDGLEEIGAAAGLPAPAPRGLPLPALPASPPGQAPSAPHLPYAATYLYHSGTPRLRTGFPWSAYLKIAEGCDNACSFCAIPRFRGSFRSRPLADIVAEARRLAGEGVVELNLVAQDSTAYGADLGLSRGPARLLEALSQVDGLRWVRLFYIFPNKLDDSLLEVIGTRRRVARYLDIPFQHASRPVLARMRRGGSAGSHLRLLERIRRWIPEATLRTTLLVGFPGETDADFETLCEFVSAARFDHLGVFEYSHEEQTGSGRLEDDVPTSLKRERALRIMSLQKEIAGSLNAARVGQTVAVLCEGPSSGPERLLQGRREGQAPEIDGRVLITAGEAAPGDFVHVRITGSRPFDLVGRSLGPV